MDKQLEFKSHFYISSFKKLKNFCLFLNWFFFCINNNKKKTFKNEYYISVFYRRSDLVCESLKSSFFSLLLFVFWACIEFLVVVHGGFRNNENFSRVTIVDSECESKATNYYFLFRTLCFSKVDSQPQLCFPVLTFFLSPHSFSPLKPSLWCSKKD